MTDWLKQWIELPGILIADISVQAAILSNRLHGTTHSNPADRILMATAYEENEVFVTADEKILKYGEGPFISVFDPT